MRNSIYLEAQIVNRLDARLDAYVETIALEASQCRIWPAYAS